MHTIKNEFLTVRVESAGAQLRSMVSKDGTEYIWQGDPKYWTSSAPNLFPYVGRLTQGYYLSEGNRYTFANHGIARYRDFQLVSNDGTKMVLELLADEATLAQYPRLFAFRVIYQLMENTLQICYEVENRDAKTMRFGLGAHPGFNVPLVPGKKFEDYRLRFPEVTQCQQILLSDDCFVSDQVRPYPLEDGCILPLRHDLFDKDAIVLTQMPSSITLETPGDDHSVTVSYPQMPYLGVWHIPCTDAPYVCIEPWCSLPSASGTVTVLEEKPDLLTLAPQEIYRNHWSICVHNP